MTKLGLVFSGGGGKGAYEIGVWRALKEFGMDQGVQAVAGTSVGGLNGALFVQGEYAAGEHLWSSISPDKILKIDVIGIAQKATTLAARLSIPPQVLLDAAMGLRGRGWFTQEGLQQLIQESGVCAAVNSSEIPFHVCALNGNTGQLELPRLNGRPEDEIEKWLLASAAIPLIFGSVEINGEHYHDGGVLPVLSNNTPYQPLINEHGCTHIISIFLDSAPLLLKEQSRYPATRFWNIVPANDFKGGLLAPLNFTAENARELIERGYADAKTMLMQFREFQRSEESLLNNVATIDVLSQTHKRLVRNNEVIRNGSDADPDNPLQLLDYLKADIDRSELDLIDASLDSFLERHADNSRMMQEAMFEGIATLTSTEGRIKHAMNRGFLSRIWGEATGKSEKLTAEIQWDLNRSVYFNQVLVQKLAERNALTLESVASMGTRLNYIMGHANYLTAASNFHQKAIRILADGATRMQMDMHRRFSQITDRIERLENRTDLQMWLLALPREIAALSPPQAVLHMAKKFYEYTDGNWQRDEYFALEGQAAVLSGKMTCSLKSLAEAAGTCPSLLDADRFQPLLESSAIIHPAYSVVHPASTKQLALLGQRGISSTVEIPVPQLMAELLCSMRLRDMRRDDLFGRYSATAENLIKLCRQTGVHEYENSLEKWRQEMAGYRVLVPLVGKFSAGKSTLLNALMGQDLLGVDISPETADASELHYSQNEHVEGIYLDGTQKAAPNVAATLPSSESNPLWYYRRHIDNPLLKSLGKLVLVDMPGLDSNKFNHEKSIANYIERGEVFVGVLSSEAVFDESVMRVLREAYGTGKELHLVVTKCGRQSDEKLQEIRGSLLDFFAGCEQLPEIAFVESREGEPGTSDFIALLYQLSSRFNDFFKKRFEPILHDFENQIRRKLQRELKLASCDDVELKQQMAADQKNFARLHETIRSERAALKKRLSGEGVEQVVAEALKALSGSEGSLLSSLESGTLQQTITSIVRPVVQSEAKRVLAEAEAEFFRRIERSATGPGTGLDVNIAIKSPEMKEGDSGNMAAGLGAVLGWIIAGPLGAVILGILGKVFGNNKNQVLEENRTLIHSQVIPAVLTSVRQQVSMTFAEYADKVADSTQKFVDEQRQALEERRAEMLENLQHKRQEYEARRREIEQAIGTIDNHFSTLSITAEEAQHG